MFEKFLRVLEILAGLFLAWLFTFTPLYSTPPSMFAVLVAAIMFCDGLFSFQPKSKKE